MSEAQSQAQLARRQREREAAQAAMAANAAAEAIPDEAVETINGEIAAGTVADDVPAPAPKVDHSARLSALEEVRKARQAEEADEPTHEAEPPEPAQEAAPAAVEAPPPAVESPFVTVKIDGVESQVLKTEVDEYGGVKAYQIIKAQEKRLHETSRLLAEAKQLSQPAKPAEPVKPPEQIIREAVEKIQLGTPEEAAVALQQILTQAVPKAADPQAISREVFIMNQVAMAENAFVAQNKDLLDNPILKGAVILEKNRRLMEYQRANRLPEDWNQFYTSIATDIRAAIGKPTIATPVVPASQPTSGLAEKEARKASIVALPTASARAAQPEERKEPTREELLARMKKARGQAV